MRVAELADRHGVRPRLLAARDPTKGAPKIVLARGMGGVGKTTLSAATARDADIRYAFDVMAWVMLHVHVR